MSQTNHGFEIVSRRRGAVGQVSLMRPYRFLEGDELAAIEGLKSMDEVMARPTPDAQKELLDRLRGPSQEQMDESLEAEFNIG